ncbi:MAG: TIGR04255 family protein [Verrucomicrobiota bacterium]
MSETELKLTSAPIVEAVVDFACDMPPTFKLAALEKAARDCFCGQYPIFRGKFIQETKIAAKPNTSPQMSIRNDIQAFQFLHNDKKQLVQVRTQGFSFNRLAPYTSLDEYLPEIERAWKLFVGLTSPVQVRCIQLRYINRILLPMETGQVQWSDYIKLAPRLPDEEKLAFTGFLNHHTAIETDTGNHVNVVLTTQPREKDKLPIIFDNRAASSMATAPDDWACLLEKIVSLRALKNRIFKKTLTEKCLSLFQQQ